MKFDPVLLKRNVQTFDDVDSFVEFARLREICDGFVASATELHRADWTVIRFPKCKYGSGLTEDGIVC
jgi:hypothetical protein